MNAVEAAAEYRLAHWAGIIKGRNEKGITIKAYCESLGIHENTYYYWLKKLRSAAYKGLTETGSLTPTVFAEVKLPGRLALEPAGSVAQSRICIEASGVRISADGEYPVEKLARLLHAVIRPC